MPFIKRDASGSIAEIFERPTSEAMEFLESEDPEIARYVTSHQVDPGIRERLTLTDTEMARVVEDLIDILIDKGVITANDLPEAVHAKLRRRRSLRQSISALQKLVEDE